MEILTLVGKFCKGLPVVLEVELTLLDSEALKNVTCGLTGMSAEERVLQVLKLSLGFSNACWTLIHV